MGYTATTVVIIYWNPDQPFVIHIANNVWFDEYNYRLSIEYNHTPGYLLLQKYPKTHIHNSEFLKLIPCKLDLTSNPFCDKKVLTYKIELPIYGKKFGFNLLDDEEFTIPYITDTTSNSPPDYQLPIQAKQNVWIIDIIGEENIKVQFMNLISIKILVKNPRSILVYVEGRSER